MRPLYKKYFNDSQPHTTGHTKRGIENFLGKNELRLKKYNSRFPSRWSRQGGIANLFFRQNNFKLQVLLLVELKDRRNEFLKYFFNG